MLRNYQPGIKRKFDIGGDAILTENLRQLFIFDTQMSSKFSY